MTCKEKLAIEHPDCVDPGCNGGCKLCPSSYGYLDDDANLCHSSKCAECWNREIPGTPSIGQKLGIPPFIYTSEPIGKVKEVVEENGGATIVIERPSIKDSGDRTEFATGAVRDMREGKGRCDLMPLEVVARCYSLFAQGDKDEEGTVRVFSYIANFQRTGATEYLVKALDWFGGFKGWSDMFLEVAKHFEEGAKKYGENNWQKGIPVHCYIDSAVRHYLKWLRGDKDEPHDRAFVWNLMCCIWEVDYRPKEELK